MDDTGSYMKRNVKFWSRCEMLFLLLRNSRQNRLQIDRHEDDVFRVTTS